MDNQYQALQLKFNEELNAFPMAFAFSDKQFAEAMEELGLKVTDIHKIYKGPGGSLYRRSDAKRLAAILDGQTAAFKAAIKADTTGEGFIFDMFDYQLGNHEYCYTCDATDALYALGFTLEEIKASKALSHGFSLAKQNQWGE